jgi:hypothetical protein
VPVPLCPPQIQDGLAWDKNRVFAVRGLLPTVSAPILKYMKGDYTENNWIPGSEINGL